MFEFIRSVRRPLLRFKFWFLWLERACWVGGALAVCLCLTAYGGMVVFQSHQSAQFNAQRQANTSSSMVDTGGVIGKLVIPRITISAMVIEGTDQGSLLRAVGHIPGTAFPGDSGTVGLAGHRDTFFRFLKGIRRGDAILFETVRGTYQYRVTDMKVVEPTDIDVLEPTTHPILVLVTCYPFGFLGHAPERFVVTARPFVPARPATPAW